MLISAYEAQQSHLQSYQVRLNPLAQHRSSMRSSSYFDNIPNNTLNAMSGSFVIYFVIDAVTSGWRNGLIGGAIAATAVLVHALITPLLKKIVGNRPTFHWTEEIVRSFVAFFAAHHLVAALGFHSPVRQITQKAYLQFPLVMNAFFSIPESSRESNRTKLIFI